MSDKNHDFGSLVCIYAQLIPRVREAAKPLGYAIAIHGSMLNDLDMLAVPWIEEAADPEELVEKIREAVGGYIIGDRIHERGHVESPTVQPHGRRSWNICWGGRPFIDLSIMPRSSELDANLLAAKERIAKLEDQLEKTADGALVFECKHLYCPRCSGEIPDEDLEFDIAYCWNCPNPDNYGDFPLPLSYGSLLSKPKEQP